MQGCASDVPLAKCTTNPDNIISQIDTQKLVSDLALSLCPLKSSDLKNINDAIDPVVIPDFVDVHTHQPKRAGILLGELFRSGVFNVCKVPVKQIDLSKNFKLNPNGLIALSRNPTEVRQQDFQASTALIGTYDLTGNKLTLVVRWLDIESANFHSIKTKQVIWSCEEAFNGVRKLSFKYQ